MAVIRILDSWPQSMSKRSDNSTSEKNELNEEHEISSGTTGQHTSEENPPEGGILEQLKKPAGEAKHEEGHPTKEQSEEHNQETPQSVRCRVPITLPLLFCALFIVLGAVRNEFLFCGYFRLMKRSG